MKKTYISSLVGLFSAISLMISGCSKSQSYSELLREEEKACNWYLASCNIALDLPADPKDFITTETLKDDGTPYGDDAPFYKLDGEGYVYMQVVRADFSQMVEDGDVVYFRYVQESIKDMYQGISSGPEGNGNYLPSGSANFVYNNTYLESTTRWGTGIQMPLEYLGYNSEVNLVLKSYYGFIDRQTYCIPYLINLKYFKAEY